jgi:hypothetical protein
MEHNKSLKIWRLRVRVGDRGFVICFQQYWNREQVIVVRSEGECGWHEVGWSKAESSPREPNNLVQVMALPKLALS